MTWHELQRDHTNNSLTDDIPIFDGKPKLYFDWIVKLENITTVTKQNPEEIALGKAHRDIIKSLRSLPPDTSWNNVKVILCQ